MALLDTSLQQQAHLAITADEAKAALDNAIGDALIWGDSAVLKLVIQDQEKAENFQISKEWIAGWQAGTILYQSPFTARYWEGTATPRSSIPFYTLASAVNSLVPQVINGLFFENPPFMLQPRGGATTSRQADAVGDVLGYQLEATDFRTELELGVTNALLAGTGIWKWGWETYTENRETIVRKTPTTLASPVPGERNIQIEDDEDDLEIQDYEFTVDKPYFQHMVDLKHVLVDPTLAVPDISKAKYVIHRMYMTWEDLDKLRDRPGYDIPSREKLLELFLPPREPVDKAIGETTGKNSMYDMRAEARYEDATIDPFQEPLEVLERWTNTTCQVVLQKKAVIYNGPNDYSKIPFLSVGWWDVPNAFYSMGLAKTVGAEQQIQQGIVNTWIDGVTLNLNPVIKRKRGKSIPTQNIRMSPGKVYDVEDITDLEPMERLPAVPEAGEHISMSQARVDQLSGAGALNTQGMGAGHSNLARTATGASALINSSTTAPAFVDKLATKVIVPLLENFQQMNRRLLPTKMLKYILNDELNHDYLKVSGTSGLDAIVAFHEAKIKFSIDAGAKMQSKRAMQAQLPVMIQLLTNEQTTQQLQIAGYRIDVLQLMRDMYRSSDWKDAEDVVVKMTAEEQQRAQMNSPAAIAQMKGQQASQMQQQQQTNKESLIDQENQARAGREVLRAALEKSELPEVLTGEPNAQNQGFTQG